MASKTKKLKRVRAVKHKPNTKNLKADQKRITENIAILKRLAEEEGSA